MNELNTTLSQTSNDMDGTGSTDSGSVSNTGKTSEGDFFHPSGSCGGIFCIDIRFVSGMQNLLGG